MSPTPTNPLVTFGQKLEAFFEAEKAKVEQFASTFLPAVESAIETGIEDIAVLCGQAVLAEAPKLISGSEKFGTAVTSVVQQLEAQGKAIAIQTAQAGVQAAFLSAQKIAQAAQPATGA